MEKKDTHGCPVCVHLVRALPGNRPVPVTAFAIDEQMHLMAAGFADGSVVLYRGPCFSGFKGNSFVSECYIIRGFEPRSP